MNADSLVKFSKALEEAASTNHSVILVINPEADDEPTSIQSSCTSPVDLAIAIVGLMDHLSEDILHLPDRNGFFNDLFKQLEQYRHVEPPYAMVQ